MPSEAGVDSIATGDAHVARDGGTPEDAASSLGCRGHTAVADFNRQPGVDKFFGNGTITLERDDAGPYGRMRLDVMPAALPSKFTYSPTPPTTKALSSVCFSAKIRAPSAPKVSTLGVFGLLRRYAKDPNTYGYGSDPSPQITPNSSRKAA